MVPHTVTVGCAVFGLVAVLVVGHRTGASAACGYAFHSDHRFLTSLRRSRGRLLFDSIKRTLEGGIRDD
jgi:hypothetical protein